MRIIRLILTVAAIVAASAVSAQRTEELLNFGWKFHAGDLSDGASVSLDDSSWRTVDVPHDFQIEQPWVAPASDEKASTADEAANVKSRLSSRGFKEMGIGWYRLHLTPSESWKGLRVVLDFEGILYVGDVYLNGKRIGGTDYGYLGFDIDISHDLKYGEENIIAVKADTRGPSNSRWYTGAGIVRNVHLITTNARMHFTRHPLQIISNVKSIRGDRGDAEVILRGETSTQLDSKTKSLHFSYVVKDGSGNVVAEKDVNRRYYAKQKTNEYAIDTIKLSDASLWSCENPNLYSVEVCLHDNSGKVVDKVSETFGVRQIEISPSFGFKLNGKKVLLKGVANHHTLGALGAAAYPRGEEKYIETFKSFGFNHIRTSHNPYSESLLRLCDKHGILVVDELYDKWLTQYCGGRKPWTELWQHDVPEFIKRDRNHPCVVVWSLGNELQTYWDLPYSDWGVTPYRMQKQLLRRYDQERPITVAMHPRGRDINTDSLPAPLVHETDIAAYNYRYMYFPGDGRKFPNMVFYQSEASTAAMGPNFFEMDLNKVIGLAYWGGIDYLGESNGWPEKGWSQGVFDISVEPKTTAYFVKSFFSDEPMVHIGVLLDSKTFNWNGVRVGGNKMTENWNLGKDKNDKPKVTIVTYTNADEVELLLNGKSIGRQPNDTDNPKVRNKITWKDVEWQKGTLEAVGYTNGVEVARHKIESTGDAVGLDCAPDNSSWKADGLDLQHIRIHAVDKKGRRVYGTSGKLKFEVVEGDARIVAVSNGDIRSDELNVTDERSLYDGSAQVILRSGRAPGKVVLKVTSDEFKDVLVEMSTN